MDDELRTTCLSPENHDNNITDHLLHLLGCLRIGERETFLKNSEHPLWEREIKHIIAREEKQNGSPENDTDRLNREEKAKRIVQEKQESWQFEWKMELDRIDILRSTIAEDDEEKHLVTNLKDSKKAWKKSPVFQIAKCSGRRQRTESDGPRTDENEGQSRVSGGQQHQGNEEKYNLEKDMHVPFVQFRKDNDTYKKMDEEVVTNEVWGKFPNQKTSIDNLFHGKRKNLLKRRSDFDTIRYFHIPSNNMLWAEQAVARYFDEDKPDFHAIEREFQQEEKSKTALMLRESHWRGQLHGGRATISSRYMRPFCGTIFSEGDDDSKVTRNNHVPRNIVLFMPYTHWETSRNRERFAQIIDDIADKEVWKRNQQEKASAEKRKQERQVNKPGRPLPNVSWSRRTREYFKECCNDKITPTDTNENEDPNSKTDGGYKRRIRSMSGLLREPEIQKKLNILSSYPRVEKNGRVVLEGQKEKDSKKGPWSRWSRWFRKPARDQPRQYQLGQYLLDAARLYESMNSYRDKKLLETYLMNDPPLHPRRTLDQAYYWSLDTTSSRDRDQVVYRATTADALRFHRWDVDRCIWTGHDEEDMTVNDLKKKYHQPCAECTANIRKVSRVVMVDQLWMWVLDANTIITCFPKRYGANRNDTSGVHKSVRLRIGESRDHIYSVFDLALIVFEECSNTFFDRTRTSDKQPQVLDTFSEAIGNIMHQQTVAFERLWRWTERANEMYHHQRNRALKSKLNVPLLDINPEGKLEREIKDIVEELGIMLYIKKREKDVLKEFVHHAKQILKSEEPTEVQGSQSPKVSKKPGCKQTAETGDTYATKDDKNVNHEEKTAKSRWFTTNAEDLLKRVDDRIDQLEELVRSANATATMVKDLLELKQQQAGVVQAWQAVNQSNEAISQGHSIFVFTVVTIVFLPLSFTASIFGMNSIEFGGDQNTMHLQEQFTYMFAISAGVIALTLLISTSEWFRTVFWYIFIRLTTWFLVHTGLYGHVYLRLNLKTDKVHDHAVTMTGRLKSKATEDYLKSRHRTRSRTDNRAKRNDTRGESKEENRVTQEPQTRGGLIRRMRIPWSHRQRPNNNDAEQAHGIPT